MRRTLRWLAASLVALLLLALAAGGWLLHTESGMRWALASGIGAAVGQIEYSGARGTLAGGFEIDGPRVQLPQLRINATHLQVRLRPYALLRGELRLEALRLDAAEYTVLPAADAPAPAAGRPGSIDLPFDMVLQNIDLVDNRFDYGGEDMLVFSLAAREIAIRAGKLSIDGLALRQGDLSLRAKAAVDTTTAWAGEFSSEGEWTLPAVLHRGQLRLSGDLDALAMEMALEGGGQVRMDANLERPLEAPGIAGRLGATQLDLASFGIAGPIGKLDLDLAFDWTNSKLGVSGPIAIDGRALDLAVSGLEVMDQQLHVDALKLGSAEVGQLTLTGRWPMNPQAAPGVLAVGLNRFWLGDWRGELDSLPPRVTGTMALTGHVVEWQIEFDGAWSRGEPTGPLKLSASGKDQQILVGPSQIGLAQSLLKFDGEVGLGEQTVLGFNLEATALDPAMLAPSWPGSVNATARLEATVGDASSWSLAIAQLSGELRAAPISASGALNGVDAHPDGGQLDLQWGASKVAVTIPATDLLQLQLTDFDLGLAGPWQGQVNGRVDARLHADIVDTAVQLQIAGLVMEGEGIRAAALRIEKQAGWELDLAAQALEINGTSFSTLHLLGSGNAAAHRLDLDAVEARGRVKAGISGQWAEPVWSGTLESLQLTPKVGADWTLADTAALSWDGERFALAPACLKVAAASACVGVDHSASSTRLDINIDALPLAEIWAWVPTSDWKVLGALAGGGVLTIDAGGAMAGALRFAISEGVLDAGAESGETLAFDGELDFDGATALLDAQVNLGEHGSFSARAAGIGQEGGELTVTFAISDLSFVDGLSAEVQGMRGRLDGQLSAPLANPSQLQGALESSELYFELPAAGLKATGGKLNLLFAGDQQLRLDGDFNIAPGQLRIEGMVGMGAGGEAEIRIVGENVGLVDLPAVRLAGDTNFLVKFAPAGLVIEGGILLRQGKIDLDRTAPTVPASEDVVIEDAPPPPAPLPITADISVAMMQAVDLIGFGIEAKLNGGVRVTQRPGKVPRGQGEILVSGIYNAYGQKLDIERGRLGFANRRVDNPSLDILAIKRVDRQRVGVQVRGTAKRPIVRMYSETPLDQSEILAMLVLGHSSSTADGAAGAQLDEYADAMQTAGSSLVAGSIGKKFGLAAGVENFGSAIGSALVVGKYISPRFFVGYGSSLLEATQLVILRFRWTENIEMELVSGDEQKGSVSWRTER
ncbi:MAG TPA: translocation/assembly module TamB domain-containing protein [Xanthomonadales bacterium]|nr:translocation/assembly module TamB domain-containing protein [Xanthomonadales bacterium]